MPKTPQELKEQIEAQNEQPAKEGHERTAEGQSVPTPKRGDFFGNLKRVIRVQDSDDQGHNSI
jgi:hypothetical protein